MVAQIIDAQALSRIRRLLPLCLGKPRAAIDNHILCRDSGSSRSTEHSSTNLVYIGLSGFMHASRERVLLSSRSCLCLSCSLLAGMLQCKTGAVKIRSMQRASGQKSGARLPRGLNLRSRSVVLGLSRSRQRGQGGKLPSIDRRTLQKRYQISSTSSNVASSRRCHD